MEGSANGEQRNYKDSEVMTTVKQEPMDSENGIAENIHDIDTKSPVPEELFQNCYSGIIDSIDENLSVGDKIDTSQIKQDFAESHLLEPFVSTPSKKTVKSKRSSSKNPNPPTKDNCKNNLHRCYKTLLNQASIQEFQNYIMVPDKLQFIQIYSKANTCIKYCILM